MHHKGLVLVHLGQGADPIGRQELLLVQHVSEHTQQSLLCRDGQEMEELTLAQGFHICHLWGSGGGGRAGGGREGGGGGGGEEGEEGGQGEEGKEGEEGGKGGGGKVIDGGRGEGIGREQ